MKNFVCPVCCVSLSDSRTFGISTISGGDMHIICMACDKGMSIKFDPEIVDRKWVVKSKIFFCSNCKIRTSGVPTGLLLDNRICPICGKILNA